MSIMAILREASKKIEEETGVAGAFKTLELDVRVFRMLGDEYGPRVPVPASPGTVIVDFGFHACELDGTLIVPPSVMKGMLDRARSVGDKLVDLELASGGAVSLTRQDGKFKCVARSPFGPWEEVEGYRVSDVLSELEEKLRESAKFRMESILQQQAHLEAELGRLKKLV